MNPQLVSHNFNRKLQGDFRVRFEILPFYTNYNCEVVNPPKPGKPAETTQIRLGYKDIPDRQKEAINGNQETINGLNPFCFMIRKQFKLLFVFDATTTSNQEPPTCLPNGSKSNWPTAKQGLPAWTVLERGAKCNEHTSWPEVAFGHWPSTSAIDGSPKTDCPQSLLLQLLQQQQLLQHLQWDQRQMS